MINIQTYRPTNNNIRFTSDSKDPGWIEMAKNFAKKRAQIDEFTRKRTRKSIKNAVQKYPELFGSNTVVPTKKENKPILSGFKLINLKKIKK